MSGRLAWSSDAPDEPERTSASATPAEGPVRVALDRRRRRGKVVTTVESLPGDAAAIRALAAALKEACGAGGTVKGRTIEIQGDHRAVVLALLEKQGIVARK